MHRAAAAGPVPDAGPPARSRDAGPRRRLRRPARQAVPPSTAAVRRVELRYVDLKAGRHLQVTAYDDTQAHTSNIAAGDAAKDVVDDLLDQPFGNWHVDTTTQTHQVRATKKLEAVMHTQDRATPSRPSAVTTAPRAGCSPRTTRCCGRWASPTRRAASSRAGRRSTARWRSSCGCSTPRSATRWPRASCALPTPEDPLRVVDLGCGNAYLTFAAHRYLTSVRGLPVRVTGVDVKQQSADHNTGVAASLGIDADFVVGTIGDAVLPQPPDVVLALHACDTATDDALARAVGWEAPLVLAAPCCHHDMAAQLRKAPTPAPYAVLTRHGILRERFADTLTDALRASILRLAATAWTSWSSSGASTRRATRCSARPAPARPSPAAGCAASTTTW